MFVASPGNVLAAVDYCQLELCTLAQTCVTRFGHSRMADLINANVDLHRWFAAKVKGLLSREYDMRDEGDLASLKDILKGVSKKDRSDAKAANFGGLVVKAA
jgi:DNA polymerase I-like protein with 3'-5' exonuclease and polymerase domains